MEGRGTPSVSSLKASGVEPGFSGLKIRETVENVCFCVRYSHLRRALLADRGAADARTAVTPWEIRTVLGPFSYERHNVRNTSTLVSTNVVQE